MSPYYSILYYQYVFGDRINVALLMFSKDGVICKVEPLRMKRVRLFQPKGYKLFKMSVESMVYYWNNIGNPTVADINRLHIYSNGMFGISKPQKIDIPFTQESFDKLYNKIFNQ